MAAHTKKSGLLDLDRNPMAELTDTLNLQLCVHLAYV